MAKLVLTPIGDWSRRCIGVDEDPDLFFPEREDLVSGAIMDLCWRCPVRVDCLDYAITTGQYGIWGGTTEWQRERMLTPRHRVKCPGCLSYDVIEDGRDGVCLACGLSWFV